MKHTHKNRTAADLLISARLRQTQPRVAIINVLLDAGEPLTREQIADSIGVLAPDKTTIYRTLMNLVDKGLVHRAFLEERTWHFELAHNCGPYQCHPHFTCTRCQKTSCMTHVDAPLITLPAGYRMLRQSIRVTGICSSCTKKRTAAAM